MKDSARDMAFSSSCLLPQCYLLLSEGLSMVRTEKYSHPEIMSVQHTSGNHIVAKHTFVQLSSTQLSNHYITANAETEQ